MLHFFRKKPKDSKLHIRRTKFDKLEDSDKCQKIHEYLINTFWNKSKNRLDFSQMNDSQKILSSIFIIVGDVGNGGFVQLFQNTQDEYFKDGIIAFKTINDTKTAKIFEEAIKIYHENIDFLSGRNLNAPFSEKEDAKLAQLDKKFYKFDDKRYTSLFKFVNSHVEDFVIFN